MIKNVTFITMSRRPPTEIHRDPSVIYRCVNPAQALRDEGHHVELWHVDDMPKNGVQADIVVFHRPRMNRSFKRAMKSLETDCIVADIDDLLFDTEHIFEHPNLLAGIMSRESLTREALSYSLALRAIGRVIVSTPSLKRHVSEDLGLTCEVVRNGWGRSWGAFCATRSSSDLQRKIVYFAGTRAHQVDLDECRSGLAQILQRHQDVELEIYGELKLPRELQQSSQCRVKKPIPFFAIPQKLASSWAAIAPLKRGAFNDCKSAIKFIESGLVGCPLVASPLLEYDEIGPNAVSVVQAGGDWAIHLERLLEPSFRDSLGRAARLAAHEQSSAAHIKSLLRTTMDWS